MQSTVDCILSPGTFMLGLSKIQRCSRICNLEALSTPQLGAQGRRAGELVESPNQLEDPAVVRPWDPTDPSSQYHQRQNGSAMREESCATNGLTMPLPAARMMARVSARSSGTAHIFQASLLNWCGAGVWRICGMMRRDYERELGHTIGLPMVGSGCPC